MHSDKKTAPSPKEIEVKISSAYTTQGMPKRESDARSKQHMALSGMFERKANEYFIKMKDAQHRGAYKYADKMYSKMRRSQDEQYRLGFIGLQLRNNKSK